MSPFRIDAKIDTLHLFERMEKGQKRLAYAVVNAINAAARDVQQAEFADVRDLFQIRNPNFFFGAPGRPGGAAARIRPSASVGRGRAFAEIEASGPTSRGGARRRTLLPGFEEGDLREPSVPGAHHIAVPITGGAARPTLASKITPEFTFAGMALKAFRGGKPVSRARRGGKQSFDSLFGTEGRLKSLTGGQLPIKGRHRTFIIRPGASTTFPEGGVFRRVSAEDIEPVYVYKSPFQLDDRLEFIPIAQKVGPVRLREHLERETINALARSGGRLA